MKCSLSINFIWSIVSFKARVTLLIFCLNDLSVDVSRVLKCASIIGFLSVSPFMCVSIVIPLHTNEFHSKSAFVSPVCS